MFRQFLMAKIHGGVVTRCDLNYEGSCGLAANLLEASGIRPLEKVLVLNVSTGNRLETYAIRSDTPGEISLLGAAARYASPGDKVIIIAFGIVPENEIAKHQARILILNSRNQIVSSKLQSASD
jgi:aspartate 1-decarboxylase